MANRLQPGSIVAENMLAIVVARAGDTTRARALIAHWAGRTDNSFVAAALVAVGDTAEALDRLERASPSPDFWAALHRPEFDASFATCAVCLSVAKGSASRGGA